jgi:hypothetical protein
LDSFIAEQCMSPHRLQRLARATTIVGLIFSLIGGWGLVVSPSADAAPVELATSPPAVIEPAAAESSVSVRWADKHPLATGPDAVALAEFEVTVSQTRELTSQGIQVSWRNAPPTSPADFSANYMQVMQCWGDDENGPLPTQCQWGAPFPSITSLIGLRVGSRDLVRREDPHQVYDETVRLPPPPDNPFLNAYRIPFVSVDGTPTFTPANLFDSATTNEVTAARTGALGTGSVLFEVQTALEAPHLGCGDTVGGSPRSCWLVVVPRGALNLDGRDAKIASTSGRILGSPLSATAWDQRIVVPLAFQPLGNSCALGEQEQRVAGAETIAAAVTSWQPALCQSGVTLGYSMLGDGEARRLITRPGESTSRLAFVTAPLTDIERADAKIRYAPVAQSSIVVAYNIDYALNTESPIADRNGTRMADVVLNARLVAKLLTQSYRNDTPDGGVLGGIANNPGSIVDDPEFLGLNPQFTDFGITAYPPGLVVALGGSDANALVWQWLRADPVAQAFLAGLPDESGMRVNSAYESLGLDETPTDSFPKADLSIQQEEGTPGFRTLDMRPYANDFVDASLRVLRGDTGARTVWDPTRQPPSYVSTGAQRPGSRFMFALVDAPSAARFGLQTARLVNSVGQAVAPNVDSIRSMISALPRDEKSGVRVVDPSIVRAGAYPLSLPVYAAVNVCAASPEMLSSYDVLLNYAVGRGQLRADGAGALPAGYVPLSGEDIATTVEVAASFSTAAAECAPAIVDGDGGGVSAPPVDELPVFDELPIVEEPPVTATEPTVFPTVEATRTISQVSAGIGPVGFAAALALGGPSMIAGALLGRRAQQILEREERVFDQSL